MLSKWYGCSCYFAFAVVGCEVLMCVLKERKEKKKQKGYVVYANILNGKNSVLKKLFKFILLP